MPVLIVSGIQHTEGRFRARPVCVHVYIYAREVFRAVSYFSARADRMYYEFSLERTCVSTACNARNEQRNEATQNAPPTSSLSPADECLRIYFAEGAQCIAFAGALAMQPCAREHMNSFPGAHIRYTPRDTVGCSMPWIPMLAVIDYPLTVAWSRTVFFSSAGGSEYSQSGETMKAAVRYHPVLLKLGTLYSMHRLMAININSVKPERRDVEHVTIVALDSLIAAPPFASL